MTKEQHKPIILATTPQCPHCSSIKQHLTELEKDKVIDEFSLIDVASDQEFARKHNIRSVPWLRIGKMIFSGQMSKKDLVQWVGLAQDHTPWKEYFQYQLEHNHLQDVIHQIQSEPKLLENIIALLEAGDEALPMKVQLGISAVIEEFVATPALREHTPRLIELTSHPSANRRADAAYFLSMTEDPTVIPVIERLLQDSDPGVRQIARESLDEMKSE